MKNKMTTTILRLY